MSRRRPTSYDRDVVVPAICEALGLDPMVTSKVTVSADHVEIVTKPKRGPLTTERFSWAPTRKAPPRRIADGEHVGDDTGQEAPA